jgi:hypothetical protein
MEQGTTANRKVDVAVQHHTLKHKLDLSLRQIKIDVPQDAEALEERKVAPKELGINRHNCGSDPGDRKHPCEDLLLLPLFCRVPKHDRERHCDEERSPQIPILQESVRFVGEENVRKFVARALYVAVKCRRNRLVNRALLLLLVFV